MMLNRISPDRSRYAQILDCFHQMEETIRFELIDGNQFYFVFPDRIINDSGTSRVFGCDPMDSNEIKACALARLMFLRSDHRFVDRRNLRPLLVDFQALPRQSALAFGCASSLESGFGDRPPGLAEPEAPQEIGVLFDLLGASQGALGVISNLIQDPMNLKDLEQAAGDEARQTRLRQLSGDFLRHLSAFSDTIAQSDRMPTELWRSAVRERLIDVIQSLTKTYELTGQEHQDKLSELEQFRSSIDEYLSLIDPVTDVEEIMKLGVCVNALVLDSRQSSLRRKIERTDDQIDHAFLAAEQEVLALIPRGAITPEVPRVLTRSVRGGELTLQLSFVHLMIAARLGGLSVRIDFSGARHLAPEYAGANLGHYPRLHLCSQTRFDAFAALPRP